MIAIYNRMSGVFDIAGDDIEIAENARGLLAYKGHLKKEVTDIWGEEDIPRNMAGKFIDDYSFFYYDKLKKTLMIEEHFFGGPGWIYFYGNNENLIFSSSLNALLNRAGKLFVMNESKVTNYLYDGFVYGEETLLQGVMKVTPGSRMYVDRNECRAEMVDAPYEKTVPEDLDAAYKKILDNSIMLCADRQWEMTGQYNICLSAGYDSNSILYFVDKNKPERVKHCYSIGGVQGVDETIDAEAIASCYTNTTFAKGLVTPQTKEKLEEMVIALEGAVYERGIFLQYELAKLLKVNGVKSIICGECADQVFNENLYKESIVVEPMQIWTNPKEIGSYLIKKKNQMMLKAFGIDVFYPFLTSEMLQLGYWTRKVNGIQKQYHKEMCVSILPEEVMTYIKKIGGSTTYEALFNGTENIENEMCCFSYYEKEHKRYCKFDKMEGERNYYLKLAYLEIFKKLYCK